MSPRQKEIDENVYAYGAKESVVFVAKVIVAIATVSLLLSMSKFALIVGACGVAFVGVRLPQVQNFVNSIIPIIDDLSDAAKEHLPPFYEDARTKEVQNFVNSMFPRIDELHDAPQEQLPTSNEDQPTKEAQIDALFNANNIYENLLKKTLRSLF